MWRGAVQGYRRRTEAYRKVVEPVRECALKESCIAPPGSSTGACVSVHALCVCQGRADGAGVAGNHRFDQSAYSVAFTLNGFYPIADHRFNAYEVSDPYLSSNELEASVNVILSRRGRGGVDLRHAKSCPKKR